MKICVCSDSHGNREGLAKMLKIEKPDALIFCGDGVDDFKGLALPQKTLFVRGNCDYFCQEPDFIEVVWEGVKIIASHGHRFAVKRTLDVYLSEAFGRGAKVALYGHNHIQHASYHAGVLMLNGGTMSRFNEFYAVLEVNNGTYDCSLKRCLSAE